MKIKQVHIVGFGRWQDQRFDFDEGLQVITGLNEAGKTTLHQFIMSILFGFPQAKGRKTNTYEPLQGGPYGGTIWFETAGITYELTRLGRTQTSVSLKPVGAEVPFADAEAVLAELLGPIDKELYQAIYSFDQADLLAIFTLSADAFADRLRQLATPGSEQWLAYAAKLDKQATARMGLTKTAKRPLNEQLRRLAAEKQQLATAQSQQPQVAALQKQYQAAEQQVANLTRQQQELSADATKRAQEVQLVPVVQRLTAVEAELRELPADLPAEQVGQLQQVQARLTMFQEVASPVAVDEQRLHDAQNHVATYERLLAEQAELAQQQAAIATQPSRVTREEPQIKRMSTGQIGILVGLVVLAIVAVILGQFAIAVVIVAAGAFWVWSNRTKQGPAQTPAGDTTDQVAELMARQQALMPQIAAEEQALQWLGQQADVAGYRQRLAELRADQQQALRQQAELAQLYQQRDTLVLALGLPSVAALDERLAQGRLRQQLDKEATMLRAQIGDADVSAIRLLGTPAATPQTSTQIQVALGEATQALSDAKVRLERLAVDDTISQRQQVIADDTAAVVADLKQYFVDRLAAQWITTALSETIGDRLPNLMMIAKTIFASLTGGHYINIVQGTSVMAVQDREGNTYPVTQLSRGTGEQLYVALRLAFVQVVAPDTQLPLLIDDAFVDFDEQRRQTMMDTLAELADNEQQILYFTTRSVGAPHELVLD